MATKMSVGATFCQSPSRCLIVQVLVSPPKEPNISKTTMRPITSVCAAHLMTRSGMPELGGSILNVTLGFLTHKARAAPLA